MGRIGLMAATLTACAAGLALVSLAVAAPGPKPIAVKGTQTTVDGKPGTYWMSGSLVGAWDVTAFTLRYAGPDGELVGTGKELFRGCHDTDRNGACDAGEPSGTLRFSFVYWARYKPGTETLVTGRCVHPVIGGTGAFAKAKGVIHMFDRPGKNGVLTTYRGTLAVPGITTAAVERETASVVRATGGGCGR
jgi:hypothetical protein